MTEQPPESGEESLMKFPCEHHFKIVGRAGDDAGQTLVATVSEIFKQHFPDSEFKPKTTPSKNGNFISISVCVTASSREQLDAAYQDLTSLENVQFVL